MCRKLALLIMIVAILGAAQADVVLEEFDTGLPDDKPAIDNDGVDDTETPQRMTAGTGFTWGGKSVELWAHKADRLTFKSAAATDYAYTIMDSTGGNSPDTTINLNSGLITVYWTGGGNNAAIKYMVRNGPGNWYLSDSGFSVTATDAKVETVIETGTETWTILTNTADLDQLDIGGEQILTLGDSGLSPNLNAVDGMGIYLASDLANKQKAEVYWIELDSLGPPRPVKATNPAPEDDSGVLPTGIAGDGVYMELVFKAGSGATTHTAYFSSNFDNVNDRNPDVLLGNPPYANQPGFETAYYVGMDDPLLPEFARTPLERGTTYYWVVDESNGTATYPGDVWNFTIVSTKAWNPTPNEHEKNVIANPNVAVSWRMGDVDTDDNTVSFDVYWDTDEEAVAAETSAMVNAATTTTDLPALASDTDYFWKVNTILMPKIPPFTPTVTEGDVWHFTTMFSLPEVDPNLVAWWKLDGAFGNIAFDYSGHANHGATMGEPQVVAGHDSNAFDFDGADDFVELPTDIANSELGSVAMWIKTTQNEWGMMFYGAAEGGGNGYGGHNEMHVNIENGGGVSMYIRGDDTDVLITSPQVNNNEWCHVAATWDSLDDAKLYTDGALSQSAAHTGRIFGFIAAARLGESSDGRNYEGSLDDVKLYDYVLSERDIKLMAGRVTASSPNPTNHATDVSRTPTLTWSPGAFVASLNGNVLYYSEDRVAVANRTATTVTRTDPTSAVQVILDLGNTYYWAVDTVNGVDSWPGDIWSFTTVGWLSVDDMESYTPWTTAGNDIFTAWRDGLGDCTPGNGNLTGANLTENASPVFDGLQSMKYDYDNDGMVYSPCDLAPLPRPNLYSKIEAQVAGLISGIGTDWEVQGVKALSLRFHGAATNGIEPMWVQLSDGTKTYGNKVTYGDYEDEDPNAITQESWHEWFIDMADFDADLDNVVSISIGFGNEDGSGNHGNGTVYFDDFRLYTPKCFPARHTQAMAKIDFAPLDAPDCLVDYRELNIMADDWLDSDIAVYATAPPDANLVVRYEFTGNFNDSSANGFNGIPKGDAKTLYDPDWGGDVALFDGDQDYVDCGNPPQLDFSTGNWTVAAWIKTTSGTGQHMIYCKGGDRDGGIRYMLALGENNDHRITLTLDDNTNKIQRDGDINVDNGEWRHVLGMRDGNTLRLYIDGVQDGGTTDLPDNYDISGTSQTNAFIGANWDNQASQIQKFFDGSIDDVRVYNKALSHAEILSVIGLPHLLLSSPAEIYDDAEAGSRVINFKDYAELMTNWLVELKYPQ